MYLGELSTGFGNSRARTWSLQSCSALQDCSYAIQLVPFFFITSWIKRHLLPLCFSELSEYSLKSILSLRQSLFPRERDYRFKEVLIYFSLSHMNCCVQCCIVIETKKLIIHISLDMRMDYLQKRPSTNIETSTQQRTIITTHTFIN